MSKLFDFRGTGKYFDNDHRKTFKIIARDFKEGRTREDKEFLERIKRYTKAKNLTVEEVLSILVAEGFTAEDGQELVRMLVNELEVEDYATFYKSVLQLYRIDRWPPELIDDLVQFENEKFDGLILYLLEYRINDLSSLIFENNNIAEKIFSILLDRYSEYLETLLQYAPGTVIKYYMVAPEWIKESLKDYFIEYKHLFKSEEFVTSILSTVDFITFVEFLKDVFGISEMEANFLIESPTYETFIAVMEDYIEDTGNDVII